MTRCCSISAFSATVILLVSLVRGQTFYLGFDRNAYPGDANLRALRQTFSYTGYWLNHPPGSKTNSWTGHRAAIEAYGFGFLVLFNGRLYAELKTVANAAHLGQADARDAVSAADREGFPHAIIIFLDQEEGGRMLPEQKAYLYAWVDGVTASGFRAGLYCSGIAANEPSGASVITAEDVRQSAAGRRIVYFVSTTRVRPLRAASSLDAHRIPRKAASGTQKSGNSPSLRAARISVRAARTTIPTATVTLPVSIPRRRSMSM